MDNTVPQLFAHYKQVQERLMKQVKNTGLRPSERVKYLEHANRFGEIADTQLEIQLSSVE